MLFNSFDFLVFFPFVTILYFLIAQRYRWAWLLLASCYFYMAFVPIYILILGATIVIDYFAGIWIENAHENRKKTYLILSLISNIGVLAVFKYYNFFIENLNELISIVNWNGKLPYLNILLPIGLSFHTFQAMSYTIEVYRGNQKAEKHFGIYALYVMFYPQLVAGPIERPQNILRQFYEKHSFEYKRISNGLKLIVWGMFKKVVIADRLAIMVNYAYNDPQHHHGIPLLIASIFFCFQIYCDFSGYTDIALGCAEVMGFKLMKNFNRPFSSKTITEFWRRWHISLSTWFNDYLFTPFITNSRSWGITGIALGLFITFSLSGLWHGAGWTFIIYGCLHGVALIYELLTKKIRKKWSKKIPPLVYNPLSVLFTFCFVAFSWIFFRAKSVDDAFYIITHLFNGWGRNIADIIENKNFSRMYVLYLGQLKGEFFIGIAGILFMEFIHCLQRERSIRDLISTRPFYQRYLIYQLAILSIVFYGVFEKSQFIYFQF